MEPQQTYRLRKVSNILLGVAAQTSFTESLFNECLQNDNQLFIMISKFHTQLGILQQCAATLISVTTSGPGYSKLTTSLVNVSLKFQTLISEIRQYVLLKKNVRSFYNTKASLIFSTKNISVFGYKIVKHITSSPLKEHARLTML